MLLAAAAAPAPGFFDAGIGRFLLSPGFGGLLAFFAALLVYAAARAQAKITRERDRQERWWATLTWVYDRATAQRDAARLPAAMALDMFDRLCDLGKIEVEWQAVLGLIDLFTDDSDDDQSGESEAP